ncbi:hypothetical protein [Pseudozobellia thermophila]|uniref:Uncharacterized protein n=1 Tax=Pseudozobellia thermophila TaxID=192903 RepID=A0A1M6L951_9FLAO|nr:hypothetical protein [Pseudozobellia thermophila]SHJ67683.1 hypothetical protein SAMN04488513_10770 [Pseudozobellia thermophila]
MGKIYSAEQSKNYNYKVSDSTVKFLLDYSKALDVMEAEGIKFESNLN